MVLRKIVLTVGLTTLFLSSATYTPILKTRAIALGKTKPVADFVSVVMNANKVKSNTQKHWVHSNPEKFFPLLVDGGEATTQYRNNINNVLSALLATPELFMFCPSPNSGRFIAYHRYTQTVLIFGFRGGVPHLVTAYVEKNKWGRVKDGLCDITRAKETSEMTLRVREKLGSIADVATGGTINVKGVAIKTLLIRMIKRRLKIAH